MSEVQETLKRAKALQERAQELIGHNAHLKETLEAAIAQQKSEVEAARELALEPTATVHVTPDMYEWLRIVGRHDRLTEPQVLTVALRLGLRMLAMRANPSDAITHELLR